MKLLKLLFNWFKGLFKKKTDLEKLQEIYEKPESELTPKERFYKNKMKAKVRAYERANCLAGKGYSKNKAYRRVKTDPFLNGSAHIKGAKANGDLIISLDKKIFKNKKELSPIKAMRKKMREYLKLGLTREYYPRNKHGIKWVQMEEKLKVA